MPNPSSIARLVGRPLPARRDVAHRAGGGLSPKTRRQLISDTIGFSLKAARGVLAELAYAVLVTIVVVQNLDNLAGLSEKKL